MYRMARIWTHHLESSGTRTLPHSLIPLYSSSVSLCVACGRLWLLNASCSGVFYLLSPCSARINIHSIHFRLKCFYYSIRCQCYFAAHNKTRISPSLLLFKWWLHFVSNARIHICQHKSTKLLPTSTSISTIHNTATDIWLLAEKSEKKCMPKFLTKTSPQI